MDCNPDLHHPSEEASRTTPTGESWQRQHPSLTQIPQWLSESWLIHGFSTRRDDAPAAPGKLAELDLGFSATTDPETVLQNRQKLLRLAGWSGHSLVTLKQMHSSLSRRVTSANLSDRATLWGDGLMTDERDVLLGIQTADCLPVLVADRKRQVVAAFHAGWRGTLKKIVARGIDSLHSEFGCETKDLTAAIGPCIGACCFEVGDDVRRLFSKHFSYSAELFSGREKSHLDLVEANRRQLLDTGVPAEAIFCSGECTVCRNDKYFSYRAEQGATGRMLALIGISADSK